VMYGGESGLRGNSGQALVHQKLHIAVEMDVLDSAAASANQVVVMSEQGFGQLEVSVVASGADLSDGAAANQDVQIAVCRTLGEVSVGRHDVRQGHRLPGMGQHIHKLPAPGSVAMILPGQPGPYLQVDFRQTVFVAGHRP